MISAEKVPAGEVERVRRESLEDFKGFLESIKRLSERSEQTENLEQYQRVHPRLDQDARCSGQHLRNRKISGSAELYLIDALCPSGRVG